eukprot:SAG31_NODE_3973_length_3702_cov_3.586848_1_plen_77_part_00
MAGDHLAMAVSDGSHRTISGCADQPNDQNRSTATAVHNAIGNGNSQLFAETPGLVFAEVMVGSVRMVQERCEPCCR